MNHKKIHMAIGKRSVACLLAVVLATTGSLSELSTVQAAGNETIPTQEIEIFSAVSDNDVMLAANVSNPMEVTIDETLTEDRMIDELIIREGTLDLNGYTLTVLGDIHMMGGTLDLHQGSVICGGNLLQPGGTISIEGGLLQIEGDYRLCSEEYDADAHQYGSGDGVLLMLEEESTVLVKGSFTNTTSVDHRQKLEMGTFQVQGDFFVDCAYSAYAFTTSYNLEVVLGGQGQQTISFAHNETYDSYLYDITFQGGEHQRITLGENVYVTGEIEDNGCEKAGYLLCGNNCYFVNPYYGDLYFVKDSNVRGTIYGNVLFSEVFWISEVEIHGDLTSVGAHHQIYLSGGKLSVYGNLTLDGAEESGGIATGYPGYIYVQGDVYCGEHEPIYLHNGNLWVDGNLTVSKRINTECTLILGGEEKQTVTSGDGICVRTLELRNHSEEGVYCAETIVCDTLIQNGCRLQFGDFESVSGWTLAEDEVYEGDLVLGEGTLKLNGHTLTVTGDLIHMGGELLVDGGSLLVQGDYCLATASEQEGERLYGLGDGVLMMVDEQDYVSVGGNFLLNCARNQGSLWAGTLEVQGDLRNESSFYALGFFIGDSFTLRFTGTGQQTVDGRAYPLAMTNVEFANESEEGIRVGGNVSVSGRIEDNGCPKSGSLEITKTAVFASGTYTGDIYSQQKRSFEEPLVIRGTATFDADVTINSDLTVYGNMTVARSKTLELSSARLSIYGDLIGDLYAKMRVSGTSPYVCVDGNLDWQGSLYASTPVTVETHSDIRFTDTAITDANITFLLSGDEKQCFYVPKYSRIARLELQNSSEEGVWCENPVEIYALVQNDTPFWYGDTLAVAGWRLEADQVYEGDLILAADTLDLNGHTLTVQGNLIQLGGVVSANGGKLLIAGDYLVSAQSSDTANENQRKSFGTISMRNDADYVLVEGNFVMDSDASQEGVLFGGVLEVKGDFTWTQANAFRISASHKIRLSGTDKQLVSVADGVTLGTVELDNHSEEGVYCAQIFKRAALLRNGCRLRYAGMEGEFGWTLTEDYEVEGDFVLLDDTLDLNGHCMSVQGDLIQIAGEVRMNGGSLKVQGNYRQQARIGTGEEARYEAGAGKLRMQKGEDRVSIGGDYILQTSEEVGTFSAGTLEIGGDLIQLGTNTLSASVGHTLSFAGSGRHTVTAAYMPTVGNLTIASSEEEPFVLNSPLTALGIVTVGDREIDGTGTLRISAVEQLTQRSWDGNLTLTESSRLSCDLNVGGKLTNSGRLYTNDHMIRAGAIEVKNDFYLENGKVWCDGDFRVDSYGKLYMQQPFGRIVVGKDFYMASRYSHSGCLTDGFLEIRGDFTQNSSANFIASENHTTILSKNPLREGGNYVQTVYFAYGGSAASKVRFNKLVLKKSLEGYHFKNTLEYLYNELVIDEEEKLPTAIGTLTATEVTAASITLSYTEAEAVMDVAGYVICRNGVQIGATKELVYVDTGLTPETGYTYQVYALDKVGNTAAESPLLSVQTIADTVAPAQPQPPTVTALTGASIELKWTVPFDETGVAGYRVYRNDELLAESLTANVYKDTGLALEKTYAYTLEAYDHYGNVSVKSEALQVKTQAPHISSVKPADGSAFATNPTLYVYYADRGSNARQTLKIEYQTTEGEWQLVTEENVRWKVIEARVSYVWSLKNFTGERQVPVRYTLSDADGFQDVWEVTYRIDKEAPEQVQGLSAPHPGRTIALTWEPSESDDCVKYIVYRRKTQSENWTKLAFVTGRDNTGYIDKTGVVGDTYEYAVAAVDDLDNVSVLSDYITVQVLEDAEAPIVDSLTPAGGKLYIPPTLTAHATDNFAVEKISFAYRRQGEEAWLPLAAVTTQDGSASYMWDTAALPDGAYEIGAWAIDSSGNISEAEYIATFTVYNTGMEPVLEENLTLTHDAEVDDLTVLSGMLDLRGHTLTVHGTLLQTGGYIDLKGGKLIVEGDYQLQSAGSLIMTYQTDEVFIGGDWLLHLNSGGQVVLTRGVLEIKGDIRGEVKPGFRKVDVGTDHTLRLSGNRRQALDCAGVFIGFDKLEITNDSEDGVCFVSPLCITNYVKDNGCPKEGTLYVYPTTKFEGGVYTGDLLVWGSGTLARTLAVKGTVTNRGIMTVTGELQVEGDFVNQRKLELYGGRLTVSGDFRSDTDDRDKGLFMTSTAAYLYVGGNFTYKGYVNGQISKGTLEVAGDFTATSGFWATDSHKLILSGDRRQTITMAQNLKLATLELRNYSEEGVYSDRILSEDKLVGNGCRLTYSDMTGLVGTTLTEDTTIEGDYALLDGKLDLNGHTLTVKGDFIQMLGDVYVHGGALIVQGDYRGQLARHEEEDWNYDPGTGGLLMQTDADYVQIKGDFIFQPAEDNRTRLTAGTLELAGDLRQLGTQGLVAEGKHTLLLAGEDTQTITADTEIKAANLRIANPSMQGQSDTARTLVLQATIAASGTVTDGGATILGDGALSLADPDCLEEHSWSGNLVLETDQTTEEAATDTILLAQDLTVGRGLTVKSPLALGEHSLHANSITLEAALDVQNGAGYCENDFTVKEQGRLLMQEEQGRIFVGGNFTFASTYPHSGLLTAGELEIQGDFTQKTAPNFIATETHTTILSKDTNQNAGAYRQTISFAHPGSAKMNILVLEEDITQYLYLNDRNTICRQLIVRKDAEAPATPALPTIAARTGSAITLSWSVPYDNVGVVGYHIYRDDEKIASGVTDTTYKDTGLEANTIYHYTMEAYDAAGNISQRSATLATTTVQPHITQILPADHSEMGGEKTTLTVRFGNAGNSTGNCISIAYRDETGQWSILTPTPLP
ncbi:MAG: hypothetical protein IJ833_03990, partial [Lachnospiraceae bacterium]|nr:hypothetical protein [Lachnospiraceae bacterium]